MDIGQMFISLGIKGDTKGIDNVIKRIDVLNQKVKTLDKSFKELDQSIKIKGSFGANIGRVSAGSSGGSSARSYASLQSKAEDKAAKDQEKRMTSYQKFQEKSIKVEEKEKKKEEKEQEKRRKAEDKAAKNFFRTIDGGFARAGKAFLGFLAGSGIAGYITNAAAKSVTASNLATQFGIGPEKSQRFANAFQQANPNLKKEDVYGFLGTLTQKIAAGQLSGGELAGQLASVGLSPENINSAEDLIKGLRKVSSGNPFQRKIFTALISELGIPADFANALNSETFSDEQFEKGYNLPILQNSQIKAGEDVAAKINELLNGFDILKGRLLEIFGPRLIDAIDRFTKKLNNLTDEEIQDNTEAMKNAAGGAAAGFIIAGPAGAVIGGSGEYFRTKRKNQLKNRPKEGPVDISGGLPDFMQPWYYNEQLKEKEKQGDIEYYKSIIKGNSHKPLSERDLNMQAESVYGNSQPVVNNITTNINAGSLDYNSIPAITGSINQAGQNLYNSDKIRSRYTQFNPGG